MTFSSTVWIYHFYSITDCCWAQLTLSLLDQITSSLCWASYVIEWSFRVQEQLLKRTVICLKPWVFSKTLGTSNYDSLKDIFHRSYTASCSDRYFKHHWVHYAIPTGRSTYTVAWIILKSILFVWALLKFGRQLELCLFLNRECKVQQLIFHFGGDISTRLLRSVLEDFCIFLRFISHPLAYISLSKASRLHAFQYSPDLIFRMPST